MDVKVDFKLLNQQTSGAWRQFLPGVWQDRINLRDFIQHNYTPYEGDGIAAGATGNPAILAYATKLTPTDKPDIGYAMIFPGMTIVKILFVNIVPGLLL